MKKVFIAIIIILVGATVWYYYDKGREAQVPEEAPGPTLELYSSSKYGLAFQYSDEYFLEEKIINEAQREHYQIILTEDTQENRDVREGNSPGREGPVAITIDVFQNNLDKLSAEQFIKNSSNSNYKLGDGKISTTTKGTITGLEYSWSGLYEGKSLVVANPRYIYMFSVTRITPEDKILGDFESILQTIVID